MARHPLARSSDPRSPTWALGALLLAACARPAAPNSDPGPYAASFVAGSAWDDGQAELARYQASSEPDQAPGLSITTIAVKQSYDLARESKAEGDGQDALKWILFFEQKVGSEQIHHAHVANLSRPGLRLLKASHSSFDWCSNQYEELVRRGPRLESWRRSDDYGNSLEGRTTPDPVYPVSALPLLMRALDLTRFEVVELTLLDYAGRPFQATARRSARVPLVFEGLQLEVDELRVSFDPPLQAPWSSYATGAEIYLVGDGPDRPLYEWRDAGGGYRYQLGRRFRAPYWSEDVSARFLSQP